jgi:hypothetical protein
MFQVLNELHYSNSSPCNIPVISLVNMLKGISLLQLMDALVLLHLTCADLVFQLDQLILHMVKVILVTTIPAHFCLDHLVPKGFDTQVHLVLIWVASAEEAHISHCITRALAEVKERGGVEVIGVWGAAASTEPIDSGVVSVLHLGEFCGPYVSIRAANGHRDKLVT